MNNLKLSVTGMACEGCEKRIVNALSQISGVTKVTANHSTGIVEIECSQALNKSEIIEKIEDLGFEVDQ